MTIADKYTAFDKAATELKVLDPTQYAAIQSDQAGWTGTYTWQMRHDVDLIRQHGFPRQAAAIESFWSDPQAWDYEKKLANGIAKGVAGSLSGIPNAAAATAKVGQNVGAAVGAGLAQTFDMGSLVSALTNKNTWLRIGEGVMGLMLIAIGVGIMAKSSSVGSAIKPVAKTATKVLK